MSSIQGDPFGEWAPARYRLRVAALGCEVLFEADDRALLALARAAFAGTGARRVRSAPLLRVRLRNSGGSRSRGRANPPRARLSAGAGILCATMDADNFVCVAPQARAALVSMSESMRRNPALARYELVEFAVLTLAARVRGLVALHAACVGARGRAALLLGASGAGKSTLGAHALGRGLDLLAEDSVFIDERMQALGVPAFLHVRCDSLSRLDPAFARVARRAPVIRRRSGVRKYEIDLRRFRRRVDARPHRLAAVVVLTKKTAVGGRLVWPLSRARLYLQLRIDQPYASRQPGWQEFRRRVGRLPAYEIRRGAKPGESARALEELLARARRGSRKRP